VQAFVAANGADKSVPLTLSEAAARCGVVMPALSHKASAEAQAMALIVRKFMARGAAPARGSVAGDGGVSSAFASTDAAAAAAVAAVAAGGAVVRLRGLPWSATDQDVVAFFAPRNVVPTRIVLSLTPAGKPSGHGFAVFASLDEANVAVLQNRETMSGRYIEVFHSNQVCGSCCCVHGDAVLVRRARAWRRAVQEELKTSVRITEQASSRIDPTSLIVRMRGMPYSYVLERHCSGAGLCVLPRAVPTVVDVLAPIAVRASETY
jgi:hypothetical protein